MKYIITKTGGGKTHMAVLLLEEVKEKQPHAHPIILTISFAEAQRVRETYKLREDEVMFWADYKFARGVSSKDVLILDNADMILQDMIRGGNIVAMTLTE